MDQHLLRKWKPNIAVTGLEYLKNALNENNGVILLITPFAYSDLIVKMGLFQEGFAVHHLSHPDHGFSNTRFGRKMLNSIKTRVEDKFLKQRVMLEENNYASAVRYLRRLLLAGEVVSIAVGNGPDSLVSIQVFGIRIEISSGPLRLSKMTGAPVLPVFALHKDDQDFEVFIESAINEQMEDIGGNEFSAEFKNFGKLFHSLIPLLLVNLERSGTLKRSRVPGSS